MAQQWMNIVRYPQILHFTSQTVHLLTHYNNFVFKIMFAMCICVYLYVIILYCFIVSLLRHETWIVYSQH